MALNNPLTDPGTLRDLLRQHVTELAQALAGLDDAVAERAPGPGEWSVHEILVHLLGPVGGGPLHDLRRILDEDEPTLAIDEGGLHVTPGRRATPASALREMVDREYAALAVFVGALGARELGRRAHVPELAETPTGSHPTLTQYLHTLAIHFAGHIVQIRLTRERVEPAG